MHRRSIARIPRLLLALLAPTSVSAQKATDSADGPSRWERALLGDRAASSGAFTCEANSNDGQWSATCFHPSVAALHAAEGAAGNVADFEARVCRILAREQATVPVGAMEISASGTLQGGQTVPDSIDVYYLVYVPFQTTASLAITDSDPGGGRPWLHHAGTCMAHVMWNEIRSFHAAR
jgi:hypothetical protein